MLIKSLLYKKPYYLLLLVGRHVSVPYWTVLRSLRAKICTYGTCTTIYFQYNSYQRTSYNTKLQHYLSAFTKSCHHSHKGKTNDNGVM